MEKLKTSIFTLTSSENTEKDYTFYRLECPDWVNVIPLTDDGNVILVRQPRHGIDGETLEIPGGQVDPKEESLEAAKRELKEETGYEAQEWISTGWVHPNPALFNNRCHFFLAKGVKKTGEIKNDPTEKTEVVTKPLNEIISLINNGSITHSLVINAFALLTLSHSDVLTWKQ